MLFEAVSTDVLPTTKRKKRRKETTIICPKEEGIPSQCVKELAFMTSVPAPSLLASTMVTSAAETATSWLWIMVPE